MSARKSWNIFNFAAHEEKLGDTMIVNDELCCAIKVILAFRRQVNGIRQSGIILTRSRYMRTNCWYQRARDFFGNIRFSNKSVSTTDSTGFAFFFLFITSYNNNI